MSLWATFKSVTIDYYYFCLWSILPRPYSLMEKSSMRPTCNYFLIWMPLRLSTYSDKTSVWTQSRRVFTWIWISWTFSEPALHYGSAVFYIWQGTALCLFHTVEIQLVTEKGRMYTELHFSLHNGSINVVLKEDKGRIWQSSGVGKTWAIPLINLGLDVH